MPDLREANGPGERGASEQTLVIRVISVDRLTADDRIMLLVDETWPQDVGLLAVMDGSSLLDSDGSIRLDSVREAVEHRLNTVPRLRQVLYTPRRGLGAPVWVDDARFDLNHHLRVVSVAEPGDEGQLLNAVENLRQHPLDWSRPLWQMWFLPGLPDARVGLFIRLHHVVADGLAGIAGLGLLLSSAVGSTPTASRPWEPAPRPADRDLLADNLHRRFKDVQRAWKTAAHPASTARRLRAVWPAMRELYAGEPGPETSLNRLVGSGRTLARARARLDLVKDVAAAHHATANDVLLAAIAGGVRELLASRGEPVDELTVPIYVPVSLREHPSAEETGNMISQIVVPLPLAARAPAARLEDIAAETTRRKALARPSLGSVFRGRLLGGAILKRVAGKRVNLTSADLVGSQTPLSLAGGRLLEMFPLLNLVGNVTLGVAAISYAGQLNVMAVGDAQTYPDLEVFAVGFRHELAALTGRPGPEPEGQGGNHPEDHGHTQQACATSANAQQRS